MTEPAWWAQARKFAAPPYTLTYAAIGRLLGKDRASVRFAVGTADYRAKVRKQHRVRDKNMSAERRARKNAQHRIWSKKQRQKQ